MQTVLSSKGQLVLPAAARRKLRLGQGERLDVELRDDGILLRPVARVGGYTAGRHPVSGLPVMNAVKRPARKVSASEIAQLNADLL